MKVNFSDLRLQIYVRIKKFKGEGLVERGEPSYMQWKLTGVP
jgi:hypothetical protein